MLWVIGGIVGFVILLGFIIDWVRSIARRHWPCQTTGPMSHLPFEENDILKCKRCDAIWSIDKLYSVASAGPDDYLPVYKRIK